MRKYTTMVVIFLAPYVVSIFLALNLIGDVHEDRDHEFVLLYKDMPHSMDEGLIEQWALGCYLPHDHRQMKGHTNLVRLRRSCCEV